MPVYFLTVGKNGPKFRETPGDAAAVGRIGVNGRNQTVTLRKASMAFVAQDIKGAFFLDRPVLDRTGLTGLYDVNIEATPEFRFNKSSEPGDVSVFTAVQEQLGLKLQPGRAQIEVLVIDHIEKPADN
jgi:uncharacterized protein (TIGR03435 family)